MKMKSNLNFINLSIDQHWDKSQLLSKVFSVRIPNSENLQLSQLDLSVYLSNKNDTCVVHNRFDEGFKAFLLKRGLVNFNVLEISENPYYESQWTKEFKIKVNDKKFDDFNFCAMSSLEESIVESSKKKDASFTFVPIQIYANWNNKAFLLDLAKKIPFRLPQTHVVTLDSLGKDIKSLSIKSPFIIKYVHSSGGGGSFVVNNREDMKFVEYLQRYQNEFSSSHWLIQKKINIEKEFSTVGVSNDHDSLYTFEVSYDKNGYSYFHKLSRSESRIIPVEISDMGKKLSQWLQEHNYFGPFGFDSICASKEIYPVIDLNIRYNKGHLILLAAEKLGLVDVDSYRFRWRGNPQDSFEAWWKKMRIILGLNELGERSDGFKFVPYVFSGMRRQENMKTNNKKILELSYFMAVNRNSDEADESWKNCIERAILDTTSGEFL